ncbi:MAG TPA: NYN domain-containing protein [Steroidobacter sp.]|uniref:NYN domain-containing protein n=1 Tax=Steroidobacter sp. TaxID=1978227 RepID=UPI002EDB463C
MNKVAILVDLGFFLPRYRSLIERQASPAHSAKRVAAALFETAVRHVDREHGEVLYRIFVYDCKPLGKKVHHPVTGKAIDFSRTPLFKFRNELHGELVCMRKVALRLGELANDSEWTLRPEPLKRLLRKEMTIHDLTSDDLCYDVSQKGVDIKLGIDIASLAYKKLVDRIVLMTGDSDFVPAAKLARREGLDVVLDPLWNHIPNSLREHIDGLRSVWFKREGSDRHEISKSVRSRQRRRAPGAIC